MPARISIALLDRIIAHAASDPDREVCGLLFGQPDAIRDARPAANVAAEPASRFEIDPAALFAAIRAERSGGARLIGHYHSHPTGIAAPSPCDAADARDPGRLWLIVAGGQVAAYRAVAGGPIHGAFAAIALEATHGTP